MNVQVFSNWLAGFKFPVTPTVKINDAFDLATVVVDFGTPKEPIDFDPTFLTDLSNRMRDLSADITGRSRGSQRVDYDHLNGVFWTSTVYRR
jgi:hypothetical protein